MSDFKMLLLTLNYIKVKTILTTIYLIINYITIYWEFRDQSY